MDAPGLVGDVATGEAEALGVEGLFASPALSAGHPGRGDQAQSPPDGEAVGATCLTHQASVSGMLRVTSKGREAPGSAGGYGSFLHCGVLQKQGISCFLARCKLNV